MGNFSTCLDAKKNVGKRDGNIREHGSSTSTMTNPFYTQVEIERKIRKIGNGD